MRTLLLAALFLTAFAVPGAVLAAPPPDSLVKGGATAVYYYANDGKRYVFPNQKTYSSWFRDFSGIIQVSDADLAAMPLGGNVTYRPGIRMVKVQTDPKVYAVARGGELRWVQSESVAADLYGQFWPTAIDDLSDAFFVDYHIGAPIADAKDFSPLDSAAQVDTINGDKGLPVGSSPRRADTEVASVVEAWRKFAFNDINRIRAENGKGPLIRNALLDRIAQIHSEDMAVNLKQLSHEGSLGESSGDRIRDGKVPNLATHAFMYVPHPDNIGWSGENVGVRSSGRETPEEKIAFLHQLFLDEPPDEPNHRTTMLSTLYPFSQIGIGVYIESNGKLWLTEDFISVQGQ